MKYDLFFQLLNKICNTFNFHFYSVGSSIPVWNRFLKISYANILVQ